MGWQVRHTAIMPVNIKDIARLSQSSVAAVSLVLNNKPHRYSEATAARIRKVAAEYGYRPNLFARSMRTGRFHTIMMLTGTGTSEIYLPTNMRIGLNNVISERGYHMGLSYIKTEDFNDPGKVPDPLQEWRSDGFLLNYNLGPPKPLVDLIEKQKMPHVSLNVRGKHDCVYVADRDAARRLTRHMIELGHKRIVYLYRETLGEHMHYSVPEREAGYRYEMEKHGLKPKVCIIRGTTGRHWAEEAMSDVQAVVDGNPRPTAVIAYTGQVTDWVGVAAIRRGLEIPSDLSLACFNDFSPTGLGMMGTCMRLPFKDLGEVAATMLLDKIEKKRGPVPSKALKTDLLIMDTSAPPRRK